MLIIRYHAPTHQLFVRWFHDFDPYEAKRTKQYATVEMALADRWDAATPGAIEKSLADFQWMRNPALSLPIVLNFSVIGSTAHARAPEVWSNAFEGMARQVGHMLDIRSIRTRTARGAITLSDNELRVELPCGKRSILHTDKRNLAGVSEEQFVAVAYVMLASALAAGNQARLAIELACRFGPTAGQLFPIEPLLGLVPAFVSAGALVELVRLAIDLVAQGVSPQLLQPLVGASNLFANQIAPGQSDALVQELERWATVAEQIDPEMGVVAWYNLGRHLAPVIIRDRSKLRTAVHVYRKAMRDARYRNRAEVRAELGAMFFDSERFGWSVSCYARAASIDDAHWIGVRYADALTHAGQYKLAQDAYDLHLSANEDTAPVWRLHAAVLPRIRSESGADRQLRDPERAMACFPDAAIKQGDPMVTRAASRVAFTYDGLSSLAWYNKGAAAVNDGDFVEGFLCYLTAALFFPVDVEAWVNAIFAAMRAADLPDLFSDAITTAYGEHGAELLRQFARKARAGILDPAQANEVITAFEDSLAAMPEKKLRREVRILGEGGVSHRLVQRVANQIEILESSGRLQELNGASPRLPDRHPPLPRA